MQSFHSTPVLGILRGASAQEQLVALEASVEAGVPALEVTLNTPEAFARIAELRRAAEGTETSIGAGTVRTLADLDRAVQAGATFIVMPHCAEELCAACRDRGLPFFPGALTPTEVERAHRLGATMVKLFPAGALGAAYLRELCGPFNDIPLLACGGVSAATVSDYFQAGAAAVAVGKGSYQPDWLSQGNIGKLVESLRPLVQAARLAAR